MLSNIQQGSKALSEGFVGEEIDMLESGVGGEPIRFRWRDQEHRVDEVVRDWQDWGFSAGTSRKDFRSRRHRNYFEIRTNLGLHALIYFDRGVKPSSPRAWVVYQVYDT